MHNILNHNTIEFHSTFHNSNIISFLFYELLLPLFTLIERYRVGSCFWILNCIEVIQAHTEISK